MSRLLQFLNRLDASAVRALVVAIILLGGAMVLLVAGRAGGFVDVTSLQSLLADLRQSSYAPGLVLLIFVAGSFLGAPQFGLIAAMVAAFGPLLGGIYAWGATMVSGAVNFWFGRLAGQTVVDRFGGATVGRLSAFIGRNAFLASLMVRNVPTAPFIVVNATFGVSKARFGHFYAGMAIGIIPKILVVALAGRSLFAVMAGAPLLALASAVAALAVWLAVMFLFRRRLRIAAQDPAENGNDTVDNSS